MDVCPGWSKHRRITDQTSASRSACRSRHGYPIQTGSVDRRVPDVWHSPSTTAVLIPAVSSPTSAAAFCLCPLRTCSGSHTGFITIYNSSTEGDSKQTSSRIEGITSSWTEIHIKTMNKTETHEEVEWRKKLSEWQRRAREGGRGECRRFLLLASPPVDTRAVWSCTLKIERRTHSWSDWQCMQGSGCMCLQTADSIWDHCSLRSLFSGVLIPWRFPESKTLCSSRAILWLICQTEVML